MTDWARALWLDVEASGLAKDSYPIEIGWCDFAGNTGNVLIKPCPEWTHWDGQAEALHGISRAQLEQSGQPVAVVAKIMAEVVAGKVVFSDSTSYDQTWLFRLFNAAGWPGVPCRLEDADALLVDVVKKGRLGAIDKIEIDMTAQKVAPITHRAADDARHWATMTRLAWERGGQP